MIFRVNTQTKSFEPIKSTWSPKELELEKYLLSSFDTEESILESSVFGETLLLISNQVKTRQKKRADILALDRAGNAVIIELKRSVGILGVETQALQYLADFSVYRGRDFVTHFSKYSSTSEDQILGFLGDDFRIDDINRRSRIILVARSFDEALFSMGEWLSQKGIAFRCVEYTPLKIGQECFISFSIAFDRTPEALYPLLFQRQAREPEYYWHNIGKTSDEWWFFLVRQDQISTSFHNQPGDQGEQLLRKYIAGDVVIAYATGYGALGWGMIEDPNSYRLLKQNDQDDRLNGEHLHRLDIVWKATASSLSEGISPNIVRKDFGIFHPISTSVRIGAEKARRLVDELNKKYSQAGKRGAGER